MMNFLCSLTIFASLCSVNLGALSVFSSNQVGSSPTNGDILTTDGSRSSWVTPASLGLGSNAYEIATTSSVAVSRLAYYTKASGRTTIGGVATSSLTINAPLTTSGTPGALVGGSNLTVDIDDIKATDLDLTDITLNDFTNDAGFITGIGSLSIEALSDVAAMTENYGDLLYWNGSSWADIATSSLGLASGISLIGPAGQTQNGPTVTLATSTSATNGLTPSLVITGATDTLTYTSSISGTLTVAGGGTGVTTLTGLAKGNGAGAFTAGVDGTDFTLIDAVSCTNQVMTALTAAGVGTCSSINNAYWSGTDLSVANGGTGLSTFGGTNTVLYTTAADTLSSEAAFTYAPTTNLLTFDNASTSVISIGSSGVTLNNDGDGALRLTGTSAGNDESILINLDDTANQVVWSSSTGVATSTWTSIGLDAVNAWLSGAVSAARGYFTGSLNIPYSAAPTVSTNGDIGIDSTSNQFKYQSGGSTYVLGNGYLYPAFTYATSTSWTGTTTIPLGPAFVGETWSRVMCFTDAGTVKVSFYDGTNRMNIFQASTTVGTVTLSTNNTFTAAEKRYVDVGTPASSPKKISCTVRKAITAD